MATERTFVMIKPDGVRRGLTGEIISRFERKGLIIEKMSKKVLTRDEAERLYEVHKGKAFLKS